MWITEKLLLALALAACSFKCVNFLQLGGYRPRAAAAYFKTRDFIFLLGSFALSLAVDLVFPEIAFYVVLVTLAAVFVFERLQPKKTPLKFTKRAVRLLLCAFGCFFGLSFLFYVYLIPLLPAVVLLSLALVYPVEKLVGNYYISKAKAKLKKSGAVVIGITGSFGKTSVKHALASVLSVKFKVFATPKSYNTPLGIAKAVNETDLTDTEIFIAELGARRKNDILSLVKFVKPHHGIITGVAAAHLETFKSLENIAAEKFRLAQNLRDGGWCVFNLDNEYTRRMYCGHGGNKTSVSLTDETADVFADGITVSADGCGFDLYAGGKTARCRTKLLGRHNILNACLCAALALKLGMDADEIAEGIGLAAPVPHRLQLIRGAGGLLILDDSFNANLEGIAAAADTLRLFGGKKAVIACGIVEGGKEQFDLNVKAGEIFAEACDYVFLTGPNAEALEAGLRNKNFGSGRVFVEKNLDDAVKRAGGLLGAGDVLLFSNDLPDNINTGRRA